MGTPTTDIGPGLGAFVAFFVLALLLWLLMRNMNGRMRRMAYRERERMDELEAQERAEQEKAEQEKSEQESSADIAPQGETDDSTPPPGGLDRT